MQNRSRRARRPVGALLLAICLNLAIIPCAMALETLDEEHDCCPSEVRLKASECCELDAATIDTRGERPDIDSTPDLVLLLTHTTVDAPALAPARYAACVDPPVQPGESPPLYKLHCAYLK